MWCRWRGSYYFGFFLPWYHLLMKLLSLLGTGLLTAVHKDRFKVLNYRELLFNDFGDRVAQLLHVESVVPFWQSRSNNVQQQILIVNTHLLFPHNSTLSIVRLHQVVNCALVYLYWGMWICHQLESFSSSFCFCQVYKILQCVQSYLIESKLSPIPVILCGSVFYGSFWSCTLIIPCWMTFNLIKIWLMYVVTGTEANEVMFIAFSGLKDLFHPMMLLIAIQTVMQMLTR